MLFRSLPCAVSVFCFWVSYGPLMCCALPWLFPFFWKMELYKSPKANMGTPTQQEAKNSQLKRTSSRKKPNNQATHRRQTTNKQTTQAPHPTNNKTTAERATKLQRKAEETSKLHPEKQQPPARLNCMPKNNHASPHSTKSP